MIIQSCLWLYQQLQFLSSLRNKHWNSLKIYEISNLQVRKFSIWKVWETRYHIMICGFNMQVRVNLKIQKWDSPALFQKQNCHNKLMYTVWFHWILVALGQQDNAKHRILINFSFRQEELPHCPVSYLCWLIYQK